MSKVAFPVSVQHQPPVPGARPRTGGPQAPQTSPFAMLLQTDDSPPPSKPQRSDRAQPNSNARASSPADAAREQPAASARQAPDAGQSSDKPNIEQTVTAEADETKEIKAETALDPFAIALLEEGQANAEAAALDLSLLMAAASDPALATPKDQAALAVVLPAAAAIETPPSADAGAAANADALKLAAAGSAAKSMGAAAPTADAAAVNGQNVGSTATATADPSAAKSEKSAPAAMKPEADASPAMPKPAAEAASKGEAEAGRPQGNPESNAPAKTDGKPENRAGGLQDAAQKPGDTAAPRADLARDYAEVGKPAADSTHVSAMHASTERFGNLSVQGTQLAGAATTASPAVPITGLAVEIATRAQAGRNRFEIRLDPPELGRIDVRLDVDRSGQVTSRLVVEKVETLEMLRRDAAELERALQQAGLKTADNGMQFTLRDQSFAGRDDSPSSRSATLIVPDNELGAAEILATSYGRVLRPGGGIDIRV